MDWLKRMLESLDYIEEHIEEPFQAEKIAQAACSSSFHYQRLFHVVTGMTLAEYVRRRKLTLAAQELNSSRVKVIDVALKYAYDTPESFSKAFRKLHGISPSEARKPSVKLKACPKISFHLSLKGDQEMDYRIVEKEGFTVVGKELRVTTRDDQMFKDIPAFWETCSRDGSCETLCRIGKGNVLGGCWVLGICMDMEHGSEEFTYMAAVEGTADDVPEGFVARTIPPSSWAVFTSIGPMPTAIQKTIGRIYQEWFPSTGYEHAGTAEMEVYFPGDNCSADYRCEVWVPIIKKS